MSYVVSLRRCVEILDELKRQRQERDDVEREMEFWRERSQWKLRKLLEDEEKETDVQEDWEQDMLVALIETVQIYRSVLGKELGWMEALEEQLNEINGANGDMLQGIGERFAERIKKYYGFLLHLLKNLEQELSCITIVQDEQDHTSKSSSSICAISEDCFRDTTAATDKEVLWPSTSLEQLVNSITITNIPETEVSLQLDKQVANSGDGKLMEKQFVHSTDCRHFITNEYQPSRLDEMPAMRGSGTDIEEVVVSKESSKAFQAATELYRQNCLLENCSELKLLLQNHCATLLVLRDQSSRLPEMAIHQAVKDLRQEEKWLCTLEASLWQLFHLLPFSPPSSPSSEESLPPTCSPLPLHTLLFGCQQSKTNESNQ